jgi:hypothetical protein
MKKNIEDIKDWGVMALLVTVLIIIIHLCHVL